MPFLLISLLMLTVFTTLRNSNVKIVTYVKLKRDQKGKANLKNIAGQVLTYKSRKCHCLNIKLDLERTMGELGKPILKKIR